MKKKHYLWLEWGFQDGLVFNNVIFRFFNIQYGIFNRRNSYYLDIFKFSKR